MRTRTSTPYIEQARKRIEEALLAAKTFDWNQLPDSGVANTWYSYFSKASYELQAFRGFGQDSLSLMDGELTIANVMKDGRNRWVEIVEMGI